MKAQLTRYQNRVNQVLESFLQSKSTAPSPLKEAIEYATLNNGKRIRPALLYAIGEALDIPLEKLDSMAAAIELIHSYSLVHDDLPAMDDDDLRRGQPTCHIQFDEATAILVGDAQLTYAFDILAHCEKLSVEQKLKAIQHLSHAAGALGMIAGQVIDIQSEKQTPSFEIMQNMHNLKTGRMIELSLILGALPSEKSAEFLPGLAQLGKIIGLAFQVHDDILDIEGSTEQLGKPQGSDEAAEKATYPKLMGLSEAKNYRDELIQQALTTLQTLKINSPFLKELIVYISQRTH